MKVALKVSQITIDTIISNLPLPKESIISNDGCKQCSSFTATINIYTVSQPNPKVAVFHVYVSLGSNINSKSQYLYQ